MTEQKDLAASKATAETPDGLEAEEAVTAIPRSQQSWGERYGHGSLLFLRNFVINYVINFVIGAVTAYKFDTSKYGQEVFKPWLKEKAANAKVMSPESMEWVLNLTTRNQFLLCGGHALLPIMKYMKDHERSLTLSTEHVLDKLQEGLGKGNEASRRHLNEYARIHELLSGADQGKKPELSDDDKDILARHHINNALAFDERHESWGRVIKARLIGMTCSTACSGLLGWMSGQTMMPKLRYKEMLEIPAGEWGAEHIIKPTPGLRTWFKADPTLMGQYFVADSILTIPSAGIYRLVEKADELKEKLEERHKKAQERREHKREEKAGSLVSAVEPDGRVTAAKSQQIA